jgi:hypothetical protein
MTHPNIKTSKRREERNITISGKKFAEWKVLHSLREGERELAGGGVVLCPQGKYFILFINTTTQQQPIKASRHT